MIITTSLRRTVSVGVTALAVVAGAVVASPALAATTDAPAQHHVCDGPLTDQVVTGNLWVPPAGSCALEGVEVTGRVVVSDDALLTLSGSSIGGDLVAWEGSRTEVHGSTLHADLLVNESTAALVHGSRVVGSVLGRVATVDLTTSTVEGSINLGARRSTSVVDSTVSGSFRVHGGQVGVAWSSLGSSATVSGADGFRTCGTDIAGDLTVRWAHSLIGIGFSGAVGCTVAQLAEGDPRLTLPAAQRDAVHVGGSVLLTGNPHSIFVRAGSIAGDLVCESNVGPRGVNVSGVDVGGTRTGQCA
ncbi:hypothetical protein [Actinotalea sp. K2]|uniref:hypothetical protein n=1 Tax=Actinotalea sp. K2 TaxID=2939438 RepID=UPI002017693F|nr:hypothetical protein [Actinotalea sp. K2]MCL3861038.1 hypothetical protein [Actinotalea sp. K2]